MNKNKSLSLWKIRKENRYNKCFIPIKHITTWANRKEFNKLTKDRNCFGRIIKGIKPELMNDYEYIKFISKLESRPLVL